jgi:hypothetical protein
MGRGLSRLQWFILKKATRQRRVYHCEVLAEYFGWKTSSHISCPEPWKRDEEGLLENPGRHYFSPTEIGTKHYRVTRATLSRACARLEDRGLVISIARYSKWAGVEITDQGREFLSLTTRSRPAQHRAKQVRGR